MKGRYVGSLPLDARITVDYKTGKVKIGFPNRIEHPKFTKFIIYCVSNTLTWVISLVVVGFIYDNFISLTGTISSYSPFWALFTTLEIYEPFKSLSVLGFALVPPLLYTLLMMNSKRFDAALPRTHFLNWLRSEYRVIYKKTKSRIIEIPFMYTNYKLNYKATKEFGEYLEKIEIKEHPFKKRTMAPMIPFLVGKYRRFKNQDRFWYARFIFSKIPKTGRLVVYFR